MSTTKFQSFVLTLLVIFSSAVCAQNVGINATGATPNTAAVLDIDASPNYKQGVLIPRMTDNQRKQLASPATGLLIYNTTNDTLDIYNGTGWEKVGATQVSTSSGTGAASGYGVAINCNGASPDSSALLDVSSSSRGILIPRTVPGSVSNLTGLIIYNTTTNTINYYNGSAWTSICEGSIDNIFGSGATVEGIAINATATPADPSAMLDISSTNKGLLISRLSSAQRDVLPKPADGLFIYNTSDEAIEYWSHLNLAWEALTTSPSQPSTITGTATVCQGQSGVTYSVTVVAGITYTWSYSGSGMTISGNGTNSITANFSSSATSGNLTVTPSNGCGSGTTSAAYAITINTLPGAAGAITGSSVICPSTSASYSVAPISGATGYVWSYSGGGMTIASGSTTNSITATFSGNTSGTLTVYGTNSCGNGATSPTFSITVGEQIYSYTGTVQTFTVPSCATSITITAMGAEGSAGALDFNGYGATFSETFAVTSGQILDILVGEKGSAGYIENGTSCYVGGTNVNNGGGGGTFVWNSTSSTYPMIVAGGGGGSGDESSSGGTSNPGSTTKSPYHSSGTNSDYGNGTPASASSGDGGNLPTGSYYGGSGAGWNSGGGGSAGTNTGGGASSYSSSPSGAGAGTCGGAGGYGGGGGSGEQACSATSCTTIKYSGGGGGGGWTGGGGGITTATREYGGEGGGSGYYDGSSPYSSSSDFKNPSATVSQTTYITSGNGQVIIYW